MTGLPTTSPGKALGRKNSKACPELLARYMSPCQKVVQRLGGLHPYGLSVAGIAMPVWPERFKLPTRTWKFHSPPKFGLVLSAADPEIRYEFV